MSMIRLPYVPACSSVRTEIGIWATSGVSGRSSCSSSRLDLVERELPEHEPPVGGNASVEQCLRRDERLAAGCVVGPHDALDAAREPAERSRPRQDSERRLVDVGHRLGQGAQHPQRVARQAGQAAGEHLQLAGLALVAVEGRRPVGQVATVGGEIQKQPHDLRAGQAVDHGMVDLRQHGDVA
jgi:hypothetical protein